MSIKENIHDFSGGIGIVLFLISFIMYCFKCYLASVYIGGTSTLLMVIAVLTFDDDFGKIGPPGFPF